MLWHSYKVILNGQNPLPGDNSAKYFVEKIIKEIKGRISWKRCICTRWKRTLDSQVTKMRTSLPKKELWKHPGYLPCYFKNQYIKMMQHILFLFQLLSALAIGRELGFLRLVLWRTQYINVDLLFLCTRSLFINARALLWFCQMEHFTNDLYLLHFDYANF